MKDPEFIELINLYLDHEISPADAARLEAEVQGNVQRRRVYEEYCRMQKACVLLARHAEPAVEADQRNVVAFEREPRRVWGFGTYATGLFAAAACVALVWVMRNRIEPGVDRAAGPSGESVASVQPVKTEMPQQRMIARTISVTPRNNELKSAFTVPVLALNGNAPRASEILTTADARFDWMKTVQVSPAMHVPVEDLVFEVKPADARDSRTFLSHQPIQAQVEMTAFQFQR